ncbi:hypothetical protein MBLNU459_g2315t1 [Dothideomycetes sp. NU459]
MYQRVLELTSSSYLISIARREQVAQIRGKPIYVITDVTLIPLSSQADAEHEIVQARKALKLSKPESLDSGSEEEEDNRNSTMTEDDEHDDSSVPSPTTADALEPPKGGALQKTTTVVTDVIKNKGQYGRFAQKWFSKGGWKTEGRRKQGMSSEENLSLTAEQKKQAAESLPADKRDETESTSLGKGPETTTPETTAPEEQSTLLPTETIMQSLTPRILRATKLYFASRSFYFSYDYDISHSLSRQESNASSLPLHKRFDPLFFWNHNLVEPFIQSGQNGFILPVIQGFIGQRSFTITPSDGDAKDNITGSKQEVGDVMELQETAKADEPESTDEGSTSKDFLLTLISRRSIKRAGLRYLRRGVDDDGYVANNVETEQVLATPSWNSEDKVFSFIQIRGSIPLFFSQSPYSFKPVPVQYGSEATNQTAFKKHFSSIMSRYGDVYCTSLVDKHGTEVKIGESYEHHAKLANDSGVNGKKIGFEWFDFHSACRGMKFENVSILMNTLKPFMSSHGWTVQQNGRLLSSQTGVLRVNCMDCLDRTNVVQSGAAGHVLQDQLGELGLSIDLQTDPKTSWFNTLWADNGDAISRQYAGTAALKGDFTRTRKRNMTGALVDFSLTLNRYYNNIFGDYFLQTCIDYWLGNAGPAVFEDFETDMMTQDYALDMGRIRQNAIETCVRIVLEDPVEDMIAGWTLSCPAAANTLRGLPFEECVLLLTDAALYFCRFDWNTEKVGSFERVELVDVDAVHYGTYITSTLGPANMDEKKNVGLVVRYRPHGEAMVRTNTRSLANEKAAPGAEKDDQATAIKPSESRVLAFKALPPRASASKEKGAEQDMTERELVKHVCDEIERLARAATKKQTAGGRDDDEAAAAAAAAAAADAAEPTPTGLGWQIEQKDVISLADAKKSTGYLETLGYSLKKLVWS